MYSFDEAAEPIVSRKIRMAARMLFTHCDSEYRPSRLLIVYTLCGAVALLVCSLLAFAHTPQGVT